MSQSSPGRREVAYRLFAAEFDNSELSYSESDEERAPNYVVTPTGARINRLFAVGVLTEVEDVNPEMVRGRIVDPTGAFVTYAGQYQPDALAFLERVDPPTFLALSGKARTYEPEDGDRIYTSVRPESVSEVDAETRDRWVVTAAERTVERIGIVASAIESGLTGEDLEIALSKAGVDERLAEGVSLALDYYGTTPAYLDALWELSVDAVRVVAGERDEVDRLEIAPGEGDGDASAFSTLDLSATVDFSVAGPAAKTTETDDRADRPETDDAGVDSSTADAEPDADPPGEVETISDREKHAETGTTPTAAAEPAGESTATSDAEETAELESDDTDESTTVGDVASVEEELEDVDPGEFELDEAERREVEEEFGTEFSTAGNVESTDPDSETNIEAGPETDTTAETGGSGTEGKPEVEPTPELEAESKPESEAAKPDPEPAAESTDDEGDEEGDRDGDLTDAVMDAMKRLDEGDGANRETLVSTVADERDVPVDVVEEAIQDALMSGRCYEPADGTLKSI